MRFRNLKVTAVKVEGSCSRTRPGATFYVRNAKLELPPGESICLFALSSVLPPLTGAMMNTAPGEGMLDLLQEWQCPDPLAKVVFRIEQIPE
jgi:uncharacterized repeat protein (TIGR04076 family)